MFAVYLTVHAAYELAENYQDVKEQIKTFEQAEKKAKAEEERALKHLAKLTGTGADAAAADDDDAEEEGKEEDHDDDEQHHEQDKTTTAANTKRNAPASAGDVDDDDHQEVSATGA